MAFFLIFSMVLGLPDQLQIFSQLYPVELLGLLTGMGLLQTVALDIYKAFDRFCHTVLLDKCTSYEISGQIFGLICSFFSYAMLRVVLDWKCAQEY